MGEFESVWEAAGSRVAGALDGAGAVVVLGHDPIATAAVALGIARSQATHRRVAIIDLIGDVPPLRDLITDDDPHGITDSFQYGVSLNKIARQIDTVGNLHILPSGSEPVVHEDILRNGRWRRLASGFHEVIISTPRHRTSLRQLDDSELAAAVAGWRARMREHSERSPYVQLIVNEGREAGASLEHSHAQLYALGFVPAAIARERERFVSYNQHTMGGDLLAEIASEEVRRRERLVAIDDEALLVCPWASRSPFELRIIPRSPAPSFERDGEVGVGMLRTALRALEARFERVPQLNAWTISAPRGAERFHWHLDITPRIGIRAGFEMSTGVELNVFPPERAAAELREALG